LEVLPAAVPGACITPFCVSKAQSDRAGLHRLIHDTVLAGGSVFSGENSVTGQLERAGFRLLAV
jgi:hypothetical protein